jgi:hypothetical protein
VLYLSTGLRISHGLFTLYLSPPPPPTPPPPRCWWHAPDGREKWGNGGIRSPTTKAKLVDPPAAAAAAQ